MRLCVYVCVKQYALDFLQNGIVAVDVGFVDEAATPRTRKRAVKRLLNVELVLATRCHGRCREMISLQVFFEI